LAKLDSIIEKHDEDQLNIDGINIIKEQIIQARLTKAETMHFLSRFTKVYSHLAVNQPERFASAFGSIHSVIHDLKKPFEELIVFPNKEKEK
jgi:hypothetical protein